MPRVLFPPTSNPPEKVKVQIRLYLDFVSFVSSAFDGDSINLKLSLHQSNANRFLWFLITTKCHIIIFFLLSSFFLSLSLSFITRLALYSHHTHCVPQPMYTSHVSPKSGARRKALLCPFCFFLEVDAQKRWKFMASFLLQRESWGCRLAAKRIFLSRSL